MDILPKLFAPVFIFSAIMIQFVGEQDAGYTNSPFSTWINLHFGFPIRFLTAEGSEDISSSYDRYDERTHGSFASMPVSVIIFSPYTGRFHDRLSQELYPRKGIFLWEHSEFHRCKWENWWYEITREQYNKRESFWEARWNFRHPLAERHSEDEYYEGEYRRYVQIENIPWRCMVFDAVYVYLVMASGLYLLFGDTYKKHTMRWDIFFVFTQIFVLFSLWAMMNGYYWGIMWCYFSRWYADFCWFYTLLYAINIMAVVMVFFCVKDWVHAARKSGMLKFRK